MILPLAAVSGVAELLIAVVAIGALVAIGARLSGPR
jgi:hypothetical protein